MGGNDTTIGLPFELRDKIKSMKIIDDETYPSVLRRIIEQAEKVPALETEISVLKRRIKELEREKMELIKALDSEFPTIIETKGNGGVDGGN